VTIYIYIQRINACTWTQALNIKYMREGKREEEEEEEESAGGLST